MDFERAFGTILLSFFAGEPWIFQFSFFFFFFFHFFNYLHSSSQKKMVAPKIQWHDVKWGSELSTIQYQLESLDHSVFLLPFTIQNNFKRVFFVFVTLSKVSKCLFYWWWMCYKYKNLLTINLQHIFHCNIVKL